MQLCTCICLIIEKVNVHGVDIKIPCHHGSTNAKRLICPERNVSPSNKSNLTQSCMWQWLLPKLVARIMSTSRAFSHVINAAYAPQNQIHLSFVSQQGHVYNHLLFGGSVYLRVSCIEQHIVWKPHICARLREGRHFIVNVIFYNAYSTNR